MTDLGLSSVQRPSPVVAPVEAMPAAALSKLDVSATITEHHKARSLDKVASTVRRVGAPGKAAVIASISALHDQLTDLALPANLSSNSILPSSVQAFAKLNLKMVLGVLEALDNAPRPLHEHPLFQEIKQEAAVDSARLKRDLGIRVATLRAPDIEYVPGLKPEEISAIGPLAGLPPISSAADLAAYYVVLKGSSIGASVQARRQLLQFGLNKQSDGGAEYLGNKLAVWKAVVKFLSPKSSIERALKEESARTAACHTAAEVMDAVVAATREVVVPFTESERRLQQVSHSAERSSSESPESSGVKKGFGRVAYLTLGFASLGVGLAAAFVPVVPTTEFLLLASFCFAKSSPRLNRWLREHPRFGSAIRNWEDHGAISIKGKVLSSVGMSVGFASTFVFGAPLIAKVATFGLIVAGISYVWSRPTAKNGIDLARISGHKSL